MFQIESHRIKYKGYSFWKKLITFNRDRETIIPRIFSIELFKSLKGRVYKKCNKED